MLTVFDISSENIYPVCVMATMSAGKSTFLNSIFGAELLPEKNEACTARALAVMNVSNEITPKAYIIKKNGTRIYTELYGRSAMEKINSDEDVENVLIQAHIPFIENVSKPIVFFDTPGVNNSADFRHGERTGELLKRLSRGAIIYVLNATQLAANDDCLLLQQVTEHVKNNPETNICFVLNKIDMLDEDKESIEEIISNARSYIREYGIENPLIFPLSALSAKVMRLLLFGRKLTKTEERHLKDAYSEYKSEEKSMLKYAHSYNSLKQDYHINDSLITEYELKRAIENTGIREIENQILRFVLDAETGTLNQFLDTGDFTECEGVYSKKRRIKNHMNYTGKPIWICKKCRQINGENKQCLNCNAENIKWSVF